MPVTELDAEIALIVVDLQRGTLRNPTVHPAEAIVANANRLIAAFRAQGLPVVLANVDGMPAGRTEVGGGRREAAGGGAAGGSSAWPAEFAEFAPDLDWDSTDITVTRRAWSAFAGTRLHETLSAIGVTQVVIAGVATSFGIESTARQAYDLGYDVVVVTDAVTDLRAEAHDNSVTRIFPMLGQTGHAADIVDLLRGR
ncbi:MAG: cysteine hydrolase family protein [Actinomycetales bacterium]